MTEIDWEYIGASLAQDDEIAQTKFFRAFVKECKSWGTNYQVESQLAGVNLNLTDEERDALALRAKREVDVVWVVFDKDDADENATKIELSYSELIVIYGLSQSIKIPKFLNSSL